MHAEGAVHEGGWLTAGAAAEGGEGDEEGVSDGSVLKISCSYCIVTSVYRVSVFFANAKILHRATHSLGLYQLFMSYPARLPVWLGVILQTIHNNVIVKITKKWFENTCGCASFFHAPAPFCDSFNVVAANDPTAVVFIATGWPGD